MKAGLRCFVPVPARMWWLLLSCGALAGSVLAAGCTGPNPAFRRRGVVDAAAERPGPDAGDGDVAVDAIQPDVPDVPDVPDGNGGPDVPDGNGGPDVSDVPDGNGGPDTMAACGVAEPDISAIEGSDGLAVAPDGTLFFSSDDRTDGFVGRMLPGQAPRPDWLRLAGAPITTGLAFDAARKRLYVASVTQAAILSFDLNGASPVRTTLIGGLTDLNDLALDGAGNVYFTLQSDGHVHRASPAGVAQQVTSTRLGDPDMQQFPAALAFGPDGALFVGLKNGGPITRLTLVSGVEDARATFGSFRGWANGLAFDSSGRLYVGVWSNTADTRLVRVAADGSNPIDLLTDGRYSGVAFGRGFLDCRDLYVAQPYGPLRRLRTDTPGLALP
jgi:sugar lactone lactonase YvrE